MAVNHYFQSGFAMGRASEQNLYEDIIIECLKIYGHDIFYIPRKQVNRDLIFNEDALNKYEFAYDLEVYLTDIQGFEGEGDLLSKFGVEIRDTANFVVSRKRWDEVVARAGQTVLSTRPAEGDVIFFPKTQSLFEIRRVDTLDPFFQVGKLYVFQMQCELVQYSGELYETGISEIDQVVDDRALDIQRYEVLLEDSERLLLEFESNSSMILESFNISLIDPLAQNEDFELEIDVLDFTETNPFGEVYNS